MIPDLERIEEHLGYHFNNENLLLEALTHTSYVNEHPEEDVSHNERLEFLGDAILEAISSEYLFRAYPELDEGQLSKLRASMVCESSLAKCAGRFGLEKYLRLGNGEERLGGRKKPSIISDAMEAVIGAVYLDSNAVCITEVVTRLILQDLKPSELFKDNKTRLQELLQSGGGNCPSYELLAESGPDHAKQFEMGVYLNGKLIGKGKGNSKKRAAQAAAADALSRIEAE